MHFYAAVNLKFPSLIDFPSIKLKFLKCQFSEEHHTIAIQSISNILNGGKKWILLYKNKKNFKNKDKI